MLKPGDMAPEFEAEDQDGNVQSLSALLQSGELILYFYPADFTPVCTAEACAFRDNYAGLDELGIRLVGVSPQSAASHKRFAATHDLPFPLLADERKAIIRAYGVNGPLGFGVRRATYLIGADGIIRNRVVSDLFVGSHVDFIRQVMVDHE
ncbi:MAG: peroxiredoxin [Sphingomonadales bacterium]|nr:peroxiredoxin [Sphingomonadales bacterium]